MKIFLSAVDGTQAREVVAKVMEEQKLKWNLFSFYYYDSKDEKYFKRLRDRSELVLVDSGAHSLQKGKKVDWLAYTQKYAEFIKNFDTPDVLGYFEMDVDNIIGYDRVLELRRILEQVTNKIIPVWHKNRGDCGVLCYVRRICGESRSYYWI